MTPPMPKKISSGLRPTRSLMMPSTGCNSIRKISPNRLTHVAVSVHRFRSGRSHLATR